MQQSSNATLQRSCPYWHMTSHLIIHCNDLLRFWCFRDHEQQKYLFVSGNITQSTLHPKTIFAPKQNPSDSISLVQLSDCWWCQFDIESPMCSRRSSYTLCKRISFETIAWITIGDTKTNDERYNKTFIFCTSMTGVKLTIKRAKWRVWHVIVIVT